MERLDQGGTTAERLRVAQEVKVEVNGETVVGTPVKFSDTPARISAAVPKLGQDTEAVLTELGYTRDDITQLRSCGAI
jgi:crotonobetainyl-CoA:carnitine CoA-transferase CaiB-like acyl-CoA transferase